MIKIFRKIAIIKNVINDEIVPAKMFLSQKKKKKNPTTIGKTLSICAVFSNVPTGIKMTRVIKPDNRA